jgi:hypothetical protein
MDATRRLLLPWFLALAISNWYEKGRDDAKNGFLVRVRDIANRYAAWRNDGAAMDCCPTPPNSPCPLRDTLIYFAHITQ